MRYSSQTFIDASARLDEACAWLDSLGIRYSHTRVGRYQRIFADLARHQKCDSLEDFFKTHTLQALVNAAHEVAEVERIYEGLGRSSDMELTPRLRAVLRSHELHVLDDDDRSGRDFSFELVVASKVVRAGLPADFCNKADLSTEFEGRDFFVECKRLKSAKQISKRIKEGLKQIDERLETSQRPDRARGLLALNISKLINSQFGIIRADDWGSFGEKVGQHTLKFVTEHCAIWQAESDPRFLGALVVFDVVGIVGPTEKLDTCHDVVLNNAVPVGTPDNELLVRFGSRAFPRPTPRLP